MTMEDITSPHDADAEKALCALIMADNSVLYDPTCDLPSVDFYDPACATIHRAAIKQRAAGEAFDGVTAFDALAGHPDALARVKEIMDLGFTRALMHHAPFYAASIREKAERRRILTGVHDLGGLARDPNVSMDDVIARLDGLARRITGNFSLTLLGSDEFDDADFETVYLFENAVVRGQPGTVAGGMKGCKSLAAVAMAIHGATGTPLFGYERFACPAPFKTLIVSAESGGGALQATARSVCRSLDVRLSDLADTVYWGLDAIRLNDPGVISALRREIEQRDISLVLLDPLYLMLGIEDDSANSIYKMGRKLSDVAKLGADTGATVLLVHHATKRRENPKAPMKLHELNGAGIGEFCRQWILLSRRTEYDGENPGHHELWMNVGGSAGHSGSYALDIDEYADGAFRRDWRASVAPASHAQSEMRESELEEKLARKDAEKAAAEKTAIKRYAPLAVDFLRTPENVAGSSSSAIRIGAGCTTSSWDAVLSYLLDEGHLEPCKYRGKNGREYDGFRLVDDDADGEAERSRTQPNDTSRSAYARQEKQNANDSPIGGEFARSSSAAGERGLFLNGSAERPRSASLTDGDSFPDYF